MWLLVLQRNFFGDSELVRIIYVWHIPWFDPHDVDLAVIDSNGPDRFAAKRCAARRSPGCSAAVRHSTSRADWRSAIRSTAAFNFDSDNAAVKRSAANCA